MSSRTPIMLSKTFFSRCMQSMAWGVFSVFQYDRYLKKIDFFLKGTMAGTSSVWSRFRFLVYLGPSSGGFFFFPNSTRSMSLTISYTFVP